MVQQVLTKTWAEVDTITDNADAVINAAGDVAAADLSASGIAIDFITSAAVVTVGVGADNGTVSAGIFTDRTKHFEGDALEAINAIAGVKGEIDHKTLPDFARASVKKPIYKEQNVSKKVEVQAPKGTKPSDKKIYKTITEKKMVKVAEETVVERDLGAMVSVLVVAIQELTVRVKELEG